MVIFEGDSLKGGGLGVRSWPCSLQKWGGVKDDGLNRLNSNCNSPERGACCRNSKGVGSAGT